MGGSFRDVIARADKFSGPGRDAQRAAVYLQTSVCEDVPLELAARLQGNVLPFICTPKAPKPACTVVERFVDRYWTRSFGRSRFSFRSPADVERRIQRLATSPVDIRARRILEVVSDGLGVVLPPATRDWCQGARGPRLPEKA